MSAAPPGMVLVATKLHVPDLRPGLLVRDELVGRLVAGGGSRLALVCAPAGWGKTVLLTQWRAVERRPFAWVSLDSSDDDPVRLWHYIVAALRTVVPGFGGAALAALPNAGPALIDVVLPRLINELAELSQPVVLVLDDYHLLREPSVHASVAYLLRYMPRTLQLALASRADPPLPLAGLRAAGEVVEVRSSELRFDEAEADAFLNGSFALGLGADEVHQLRDRTEGWPAGLQLAALSLRGREDRAAFIRSFAGDDRQIGDYLHEVIASAPLKVRGFLLRTSILERMCGPLCDAVSGGGDGAVLLAEAYRSNLFVVALDDRGIWYRHHQLLRDLLRSELVRAEPELVAELHARAFVWHERNGHVEDAIVHAIAAGRVAEASELIARHWHRAWQVSGRTVARWLDALPPGAIEADARLCIVRAWSYLFSGRPAEVEPMIAAADAAPVLGEPRDEMGSVATKAALLRSSLAWIRGDLERLSTLAQLARRDPAPGAQALSNLYIGLTRYFRGDAAGAVEPCERTRGSSANWGQLLLTALAVLTAVRADSGEVAAAEKLAAEAARMMDELGFGEAPTSSLAHSAIGKVAELRDDLAGADAAYARAIATAERAGAPLELAHALTLAAALRRRSRDVPSARALVREARGVVSACPDPGVLPAQIERLELMLGLAARVRAGQPASAELSAREIAVLRLLVTELSQREIGTQLYVSLNTVKSHTRTVFRKLGVTSRADAVARGRGLGLL